MREYSKRNQSQHAALRDQANASPIILWQNGKWRSRKICNASYTCGGFFSGKKNTWTYKVFHIIPGTLLETLKPSHGHIGLLYGEQERKKKSQIFIRNSVWQTLGLHITPPSQWPLKTGLVITVGRSRNCENCDPQEVKHLQRSYSHQALAEVQSCIFLSSQS